MLPIDIQTDIQLIEGARRGKEEAFRSLLDRYKSRVYTIIYRVVRDPMTAEDLTQETFIKAFNALDTFDCKYKFSSWLFKITKNLTIDYLRKRKLDTISLDRYYELEEGSVKLQVPDHSENPEEEYEAKEFSNRLENAIDKLPATYRMVIHMRHIEGKSYDEIADILELPLGTVKTYIFRGRRTLLKSKIFNGNSIIASRLAFSKPSFAVAAA